MKANYNFHSFIRQALWLAFRFGYSVAREEVSDGSPLLDGEVNDRFDDWLEALVIDGDLREQ